MDDGPSWCVWRANRYFQDPHNKITLYYPKNVIEGEREFYISRFLLELSRFLAQLSLRLNIHRLVRQKVAEIREVFVIDRFHNDLLLWLSQLRKRLRLFLLLCLRPMLRNDLFLNRFRLWLLAIDTTTIHIQISVPPLDSGCSSKARSCSFQWTLRGASWSSLFSSTTPISEGRAKSGTVNLARFAST
jgi:hypothetical protein